MSQVTAKKSLNISSAIGRRPVIAAPIAAPTIACSLIGVSRTRLSPKRANRPSVSLNTPPAAPDVLADEHDGRVAVHLARDALGDRRAVGQLRRSRAVAPPGRAAVGPDLGLEHRRVGLRRLAGLLLGRGDLVAASRPRSRRASPRRRPSRAAARGSAASGRGPSRPSPRRPGGTCRDRRASGRRGGRSAPRSATAPPLPVRAGSPRSATTYTASGSLPSTTIGSRP